MNEMDRLQIYWEHNPNEITENQFKKIQKEIEKREIGTISDEYFDFQLWCQGLPSRQESFANYLQKKLKNKNVHKILEVGCGRTARLSRLLSETGYEMTCIDDKIFLEEVKKYGIIAIRSKFNMSYNLRQFDFVVAQEPCDATEHIVRACIKQNKPFIIALCGVPHKIISGVKHKTSSQWYDYLCNLSKDKKIKLRYLKLKGFEAPILIKN